VAFSPGQTEAFSEMMMAKCKKIKIAQFHLYLTRHVVISRTTEVKQCSTANENNE